MNDQDYIRKAVELVPDEWPWDFFKADPDQTMDQPLKDALAAQLVRQVDALPFEDFHAFHLERQRTYCNNDKGRGESIGPDRTMNTIKAIVDSGVLS